MIFPTNEKTTRKAPKQRRRHAIHHPQAQKDPKQTKAPGTHQQHTRKRQPNKHFPKKVLVST
ncbi:hypothetical protein QP391_09745, partial [Lactobacillus paragasseri]|uniref:hypothetical protein n=1 Tax=Lactobacillus paragasseri TaxID=2107999 RepID=UPI00254B9922